MEKQWANNIIKNTFENPFDKTRFVGFIKELLNQIEEDYIPPRQGQYIPDAYRNYISSFERIGKFRDRDKRIDILIIKLQKNTSLELARTMQRNFVAGYLQGKYGSSKEKDAALVAFVSPSNDDWRFSLVKMDYSFEQTANGKSKVKEEFTPARRWSFLVGVHENSHTAQCRLVNLLANDEQAPNLEELEKAFDIETVTKEFFEEYRELFLRLKEELDKIVSNNPATKNNFEQKGVNTVDFAKKLLGQIVFLYFLQKKGWFGVPIDADWGTGSKQFLRELFEQKHGSYKNFFNDILEPLFYDALRIDRSHDDHYYSRFNCKIPFLNGGLFDPLNNYDWVRNDIYLPNELFSNKLKTKKGDTGNGILDIFDRYNFTVKEDEPLEKEVAIDPELLGKTYEKFNAIRPDNYQEYLKVLKSGNKGEESKFNKQYGVYYTPREIVHYMCQQSLINYLYTELNDNVHNSNTLDSKKQLGIFEIEPESGQLDFEVSVDSELSVAKEDLEMLVHYGERVSENEARVEKKGKETDTYYYKLPESIRKNAKLIDRKLAEIRICDPAIGSGAFPVGMMTEIVKTRNVLSIFIPDEGRTLYNLKRQCIENSLYGVDIDPGAVEIAKLRLWLSLIVDENDIKLIKPLPNLDYKIACGDSLIGFPENLNSAITTEIENLKHEYFRESNPKKKMELKEKIDAKINLRYQNSVESFGYQVNFDLRTVFSEVFHEKGGFDVVIANPPWGSNLSKNNKAKLKEKYPEIDSSTPNSFAYFLGLAKRISQKVIAYVLPDSILIKDYAKTREYLSPYIKEILWFQNVGLPDTIKPFENVEHDVCLLILNSEIKDEVLCSTALFNNQSKSIEKKAWIAKKNDVILKDFDYAYNLLLTKEDLNILSKINKFKQIDNYLQCHEGIHTGNCRDILFKKEKNKYCKPLYFGSSAGDIINNYTSYRSGWYVDYRTEIINQDKGQYASLRDEKIFIYPKIYITRTGNPFKAFLDDNNYASNNFFSLQYKDYTQNSIDSLKIILPFILSKLSQYFIRTFAAPRLGNIFIETKIVHLLKFKIPDLTPFQKKEIIVIVDKILSLSKTEDYLQNTIKQEQVYEFEKQLDQIVYKIYGITKEEIKIIEDKLSSR